MSGEDEPDPNKTDELYQWIIKEHPRWKDRRDEIKAELLGESRGSEDEIRPRIKDAIETEKDHDELLQSTISVFDPRGRVCEETGWRILATEPLVEKRVPNPDALIGNPERNGAILIECKTGLSSPGSSLEQLFAAAEQVRNHRDYLYDKIDLNIENIDCVLCVPSRLDRKAADTIEEYEEEGKAKERVYIWRLNRFRDETLQLYENIDTRESDETSHDHALTEYLSDDGVRVSGGSEITPEFFPSSHLANIIEAVFSDVLWDREKENKPVTMFRREELDAALMSEDNLLHYSAESIGERIREEMIPRLLEYDIIDAYTGGEEADNEYEDWREIDVFEFKVGGGTTETILDNISEKYFEEEVGKKAEEKTRTKLVEEFREESGGFDDIE